ncbi:hypothetical protein GCM10010329_03020 [Streptomyces spiroverticillatus]|uniref:Uncharacterized protein n=1 Tax=Streptomyces finlayi TaxID=67296 RepID=A0A918WSC2_9ACTN|nr:hypothetical protein [Streptomyces finlayi]GGZ86563.1 hypothetical protein GCM10010329_03020 [Streptomyces spiroverticillatus]GHC78079.1 hypothetical protein GCM10010334_03000 [Streptomyces finlayi]
MLPEAMTALAAAGGAAVVQAAGTDAWNGLRRRIATWLGRGDRQRESVELERLDRTAAELEAASASEATEAEAETVRIRHEAGWQARIEARLEDFESGERAEAAGELEELLAPYSVRGDVSAGEGGQAIGGDMKISASDGSIAANIIHGGAHVGRPPVPDPPQG